MLKNIIKYCKIFGFAKKYIYKKKYNYKKIWSFTTAFKTYEQGKVILNATIQLNSGL